MRLNLRFKKFNFRPLISIFVMLVLILTLFNVNVINGKASDSETKLESLSIVNYESTLSPSFDKDVFDYNLIVYEKDISLDINYTKVNSSANVKITGNRYLGSNEGVIKVTVSLTGYDDSIYTINYKKRNIVTSGLVSNYDGYYPGNNSSVWKNLVNNKFNGNISGATRNALQTGFVFDGNDQISIPGGITSVSNQETVEITFNPTSTSNQLLYMAGPTEKVAFGIFSSNFLISRDHSTNTIPLPSNYTDGTVKNISTYYDGTNHYLYYNGKNQNKNSSVDSFTAHMDGNSYIGARAGYDYYRGTIYSVRIYNRVLTVDEMNQNYVIDKRKYYGTEKVLSKDNYLNALESNVGTLDKEFDPLSFEYTLTLDSYSDEVTLNGVSLSDETIITGLGKYYVEPGKSKVANVSLTSENGEIRNYTINIVRPQINENNHTSKLKRLKVNGYDEFNDMFNSNIYEYTLPIYSGESSLDISYVAYDSSATVSVLNDENLDYVTPVTVTVSAPGVSDTVYTIYYNNSKNKAFDFSFTGDVQTFIAPKTGTYKLETWGAEGGSGQSKGGYGAYSTGKVKLNKNEKLYVYVGQKGGNTAGGYNGGGNGAVGKGGKAAGGGGGATHISKKTGLLSDMLYELDYLLIASGGGGGAGQYYQSSTNTDAGGNAGGISGNTGYMYTGNNGTIGRGGSQSAGGAGAPEGGFGYGGTPESSSSSSGGGGAGFYGGGGGYCAGGGGGSSYIGNNLLSEKHMTCYECTTSENTNTKTISNSNVSSDPISDYSKMGNGYAKITVDSYDSENTYLNELTATEGTFNKNFDYLDFEYDLELDEFTATTTISAVAQDITSTVTGLDSFILEEGETKEVTILVTSLSGDIRTYKVNIYRKEANITGHSTLLKKLHINNYEDFDKIFSPSKTSYDFEVYSNESSLSFKYEKYDESATVTIENNEFLSGKPIEIKVSADGVEDTVYYINYSKTKNYEFDFDSKKQEEVFNTPYAGTYKLEVWGAEGGKSSDSLGGYGAYSVGEVFLDENTKLYINVGSTSNGIAGGYNGGGNGAIGTAGKTAGGGGGATSIAYSSGLIKNFPTNTKDLLIIAGGGGGAGQYYQDSSNTDWGGNAGGFRGNNGVISPRNTGNIGEGATQTSGGGGKIAGSFGQGANGTAATSSAGGGGGGYYGGGGPYTAGGGGGSGFINHENLTNKHMTCYNCSTSDDAGTKTISVTDVSTAAKSDYAKMGNGYARITSIKLPSKVNILKTLYSNIGVWNQDFESTTYDYTLTLDGYTNSFTLYGEVYDPTSTVVGLTKYDIEPNETKTVNISVTSELGETRIYSVLVTRGSYDETGHTTLLKKLKSTSYDDIELNFTPRVNNYSLSILNNELDFPLEYETYDSNATVSITGNQLMFEESGVINITVSEPHCTDTVYTISYTKDKVFDETFEYSESEATYVIPESGIYKLEAWGASGGNSEYDSLGGYGGYSVGEVKLFKNDTLYVNIGGRGSDRFTGGYNGGGNGHKGRSGLITAGGGGATSFALRSGLLNTLSSNVSDVLLVAGGGGGAGQYYRSTLPTDPGGNGGGFKGNYGQIKVAGVNNVPGGGGTQTSGGYGLYEENPGSFGQGGLARGDDSSAGGGGGGFYGGGGGWATAGGGGSGYIGNENLQNKHMTCVNCETSDNVNTKTRTTTNVSTNAISDYGKKGNGSAYLSVVRLLDKNNYLSQLKTSKGELSPSFDPAITEYTLNLDVDDTKLKVTGRPSSDLSIISGFDEYNIAGGSNEIIISVTAESGDIREYKINVTRPKSSEAKANNITITGLVQNICSGYLGYCELDSEFDSDKHLYSMSVPSGIRALEFTVDKKHDYQNVVGAGVTRLLGGDNRITIEITSEDGENQEIYTYDIHRDMTGDNYIDELTVTDPVRENEIDIGFNYLITEYSFKVDNDVNHLDLDVKLDDENASYVVQGNNNFKVGNNIVIIEVEAQNQEKRNYVLNVYRVSNSNNLLKSLEVKNQSTNYQLSPEFKDITTSYQLVVENEVSSVEIVGEAYETTTSVDGFGLKELKTGLNSFKIISTAENGDVENYIINITREKSSNNNLSSLSVSEGEFNEVFDKDALVYTMTVNPYVKSLSINAIKEVETSKITIKNNNNFKVGENEVIIEVEAEDKSKKEYKIIVTKLGSDNNYLRLLMTNKGLNEDFNKEVLDYTVNVTNDIESIEVQGEKEDTLAKTEGFGTYRLKTGINEIIISVTSETNIKRQYKITVTRDKNSDDHLSDIKLSNGSLSPEFNEDTLEYTVNVENAVNKININGITKINTTTVTGNGEYSLNTGENTIYLRTLSEDELNSKEYIIHVIRDTSSNTNLESLFVREGRLSPSFNKMTVNYRVVVPSSVDKVTIDAKQEDETSTLLITNPEHLVIGENEVKIKVISEDLSEKVYTIIVDKEEFNADLNSLNVTHCNLDFDKDTQYYECVVSYDINSVNVMAESKNETNTVSGLGDKSLNVGRNEIQVVVKTPENFEKVYNVVITRNESNETRLNNITVDNHELNEVFDKDNLNYTLTTKENRLTVRYEKMHEGQEVIIAGNENLHVGENEITIHVLASNKVDENEYKITVLKTENDNTYLKSLKVDGYNIKPKFEKGIMEYNLEVENEEVSVIVEGIPEENTSVVEGNRMYNLEKGLNVITIKVIAEDLSERNYIINVTRLGSRNAKLKRLGVKDFTISPDFDKDFYEYTLRVPYENDKVEITAETDDEDATIDGIGEVNLLKGLNEKKVIVTSENGEIKVYKLFITRNDPITSKLSNIKINNYELDQEFDSNTLEYTTVVDYEVSSLEFIIEKLDPNSTYEIIGNNDFEIGSNEVIIRSTSSDNIETTDYKINVIRQSYSNTFLSSLTVSEGVLDPSFDKMTLTYNVEVENEVDSISIGASPENASSVVTGTGEQSLNIGENTFKITVTSQGGIIRNYYVIVTRKESSDASILSITSNLGEVIKNSDTTYSLLVSNSVKQVNKNNITVTTTDPRATITQDEVIYLDEERLYRINVLSADKTNLVEYTIYIESDLSDNNYLRNITSSIGELKPVFDKTVNDYEIAIDEDENEIEFTVEKDDEKSNVLNTNLVFELDKYNNPIEIEVESENGDINIYRILVKKSLTKRKNLSDIKINGIENIDNIYNFNETTYEYNLTVSNEVKEFEFEFEKMHPNQSIKVYKGENEVNDYKLEVGNNQFIVEVENSYNEKNYYVYNIERLKNTNNYLRSLRLTSPDKEIEDFNRDKQEYNIEVDYEYENIVLEAIPEDVENATVTMSGTTYLIDGEVNDVIIKVRAENGKIREYIIHVLRLPEKNNLLKTLTVSSGDIYELNPKFTPGITSYTLEVGSTVSLVRVEGLAKDEDAIVIGNGDYNLEVGTNKIEIKVEKDHEEKTYTVNITRKREKNVFLKKLNVLNGILNETFNKTKELYTVNVENNINELSLDLEAEDSNAKIEVIGNKLFRFGENEVKIRVTSSDRTAIKTYTLKVYKEGNDNNDLEELNLDDELINGFNEEITEYEVYVPYEKNSVKITGKTKVPTSSILGEGTYTLEEGENNFTLKVISQNGDIKEYSVQINREKNTYLKMLLTDRGEITPVFNKDTLNYELEVENDIKDITVIGLPESSDASVIGSDKYNLNVGNNPVTITVKNSTYQKDYNLNVIRKGSTNTYLKYLTVSEGILEDEFDKEVENYEVHVPKEKTKLSLSYETEDVTSIAQVIGNENLIENEQIVTIRVTSTSGNTRDYNIKVIKEDEEYFSNKLLDITVDKGVLSPRFDKDINEYTVSVDNDVNEINVSVVRQSKEATVDGVGIHRLTEQRNVIPITVTSKDGKKRVYTIIVYKYLGNEARIEELEYNEGYLTPSFNKNVYSYTLTVPSETNLVTIKKLKMVDENATYQIEGNSISQTGSLIKINTTSHDQSAKKTYKILVRKEKSNNAYLKKITTSVGELSPVFNKEVNAYVINVDDTVQDIYIEGEPESTKAFITGNSKYDLGSGNNYINIIVTSEAGTTNVYTVNVVKEYKKNKGLKDLYVRGHEITPLFDSETLNYELEVDNEVTSVEIGAQKENDTDIVEGAGNKDLRQGLNVFNITVTSESGDIIVYKLEINRKQKISSKIEDLKIKEGVLSPEFMSDFEYYQVEIPNECKKITPIIKLEDEDASYEIIGNENLKVGENEVQIKVKSRDLSEETIYYITVIRQISSNNYLESLEVSEGELDPSFDRAIGYYEVEVGNNVESIIVDASAESPTTSVRGIGEYNLDVGENKILVETRSETGVTRSYQIIVIREGNKNNYLLDIRPSIGVLNPSFMKTKEEYELEVPIGTENINFEVVKESETSRVTGDNIHRIKGGENSINIMVESEDGDIRIYKINVIRPLSNNKNILNITPSEGVLTPEVNNDVESYTLRVSKDTNIVDFEVELESPLSKVLNNNGIIVDELSKTINIIVEAEDKSQREIEITIEKESSINDIIIDENNIVIINGDTYQINASTNPVGGRLLYEEDNDILSISSNGLITALEEGETTLTITSQDNPLIEKEIQVKVVSNEIKSDEYSVEDKEERIVIGVEVESTIKEFKENLKNDKEFIKVYDKDGNLLSDDDIVKTGLIIKLEHNEKIYDEATMVVRGDVDGDGVVNVTDYMIVLNHALELELIEDQIKFYAADVEVDNMINVTDYIKIMDYALENLDTLN